MCNICAAQERMNTVSEGNWPRVMIGDNGDVVIMMGPEYQAAVLDEEGNSYIILDMNTLMELATKSMSRVIGVDLTQLVHAMHEDGEAIMSSANSVRNLLNHDDTVRPGDPNA